MAREITNLNVLFSLTRELEFGEANRHWWSGPVFKSWAFVDENSIYALFCRLKS